ncbi:MAG: two-component sensor histidine kinase, partial [Proteobacteria bacterium]|nr:two-component sensor histidine kinase [Pseudomonadota bacterium]
QEIIFNKFYRVDNSLTSKQPGSGLGLSIARQILRDLDGDVSFEPIPGNGSCFTARIKHHDSD